MISSAESIINTMAMQTRFLWTLISLRKISSIYVLSRVVRDEIKNSSAEPITNTRPGFRKIDQIFVKSALWSSPYKVPFSVALTRKT